MCSSDDTFCDAREPCANMQFGPHVNLTGHIISSCDELESSGNVSPTITDNQGRVAGDRCCYLGGGGAASCFGVDTTVLAINECRDVDHIAPLELLWQQNCGPFRQENVCTVVATEGAESAISCIDVATTLLSTCTYQQSTNNFVIDFLDVLQQDINDLKACLCDQECGGEDGCCVEVPPSTEVTGCPRTSTPSVQLPFFDGTCSGYIENVLAGRVNDCNDAANEICGAQLRELLDSW